MIDLIHSTNIGRLAILIPVRNWSGKTYLVQYESVKSSPPTKGGACVSRKLTTTETDDGRMMKQPTSTKKTFLRCSSLARSYCFLAIQFTLTTKVTPFVESTSR
jgi:hypothetical protein